MKRVLGIGGVVAVGAALLLASPADAKAPDAVTGGSAAAASTSIVVPDGFDPVRSDTRATGHYEVVGTGLHIWTEGAATSDKVAEYVDTTTPLSAAVDTSSLEYTNTSGGGAPGFQLVVDFDNDGTDDGILVGESLYGDDWWLNNGAKQFVKDGAPSHTGGFGSTNHGTLADWSTKFPDATVKAFGFSLGSGVKGDGVIDALHFAGSRYTFTKAVVLTSKNDCKNGGWATSTKPVFKNQGDCVSAFASGR